MKAKLTLSVEKSLIERAKANKVNMSQLLEEALQEKLGMKRVWVKA